MPKALMHPFAKPARPEFVRIVRGEGALLYTADGQEQRCEIDAFLI